MVRFIETIAAKISDEVFAVGKTRRNNIALAGPRQTAIGQPMVAAMASHCKSIFKLFYDTNVNQWVIGPTPNTIAILLTKLIHYLRDHFSL